MQHIIFTCDYGHKYMSCTLCNASPPSQN